MVAKVGEPFQYPYFEGAELSSMRRSSHHEIVNIQVLQYVSEEYCAEVEQLQLDCRRGAS